MWHFRGPNMALALERRTWVPGYEGIIGPDFVVKMAGRANAGRSMSG
jgi:hypothetical protein